MAKQLPVTITANGTTKIATVRTREDMDVYGAEIHIVGTFGGGTVTIYRSIDNGANLIEEKDLSGSTYSVSTNSSIPVQINGWSADRNSDIALYAVLTGATNPNLIVTVYDNV